MIEINDINQLDEVAKILLNKHKENRLFAFYGSMGAGKTTFIKSICKQLGVNDYVNSPTFSLVNEYKDKNNKSIFHFDFYRIKSIEEVINMGFFEYIDSNSYCFIEWPEKIEELIDADFIKVEIKLNDLNRVFIF
ncbi:MAG: tRNA (adenosine(37)-N6)-threonylcarbamoyltransferase complex ATPase subunit type 1 TsaE [Bacteroidetes bacterium GWE2_29_8]|nr:MAG: tRNA (adenosine(37)-N6)-threonylcarbamoyltransferase complex ATPase subunit type 1 TsaE [Bacteroidetes bacterium GWE2_29_8]